MQDGAGREPARGLPHRRRGEQRAGVLDGVFRAAADYQHADTVFFTGQVHTGCGAATRRSGPSTARATSRSTSTSAFFDELQRRFGAQGGPSPRPTSSPTSTATTCRTCSASSTRSGTTARAREPARCGSSSRPTATRASGRHTRWRPARRDAHRGGHRRRARRRRGGRRRPDPGGSAGPGRPRVVDARLGGAAPAWFITRLRDRQTRRLRHLHRLHLARRGRVGLARRGARRPRSSARCRRRGGGRTGRSAAYA